MEDPASRFQANGNLAQWLQTVSQESPSSHCCVTGEGGQCTGSQDSAVGEPLSEQTLPPNPTLCTTPGSQLSPRPDSSRINALHRPDRVLQDLSCHHSNSPPVSTRSNQASDPHATQLPAPGQLLFRSCQATEGLSWPQREDLPLLTSAVTLESRAWGDLLGLLPKTCEGCGLGCHRTP